MKNNYDLVSDCCGAAPKSNGDSDTMDIGVCSDCKCSCTYIKVDEYGDQIIEGEDEYKDPTPWEADYGGSNAAERQWQMAEYQKLK